MTIQQRIPVADSQAGAVLFLAMVFAGMLAVLAGTGVQFGLLESRMAGNQQLRLQAAQQVEAIATELARDAANFPLDLAPGLALCAAQDVGDGCYPDGGALLEPPSALVAPGVQLSYRVTRRQPRLLHKLALHEEQGQVSGSGHFALAVFEISVELIGGDRQGSAHIVQGIAVRVAAEG